MSEFLTAAMMLGLIAFTVAIAAAIIWKRAGNTGSIFDEKLNKFKSIFAGWLDKQSVLHGPSGETLIATWLEAQGNTAYQIRTTSIRILIDDFIERITEDFHVIVAKNICTMETRSCTLVYELTPKEGTTTKYYLALSTGEQLSKDSKDRPQYVRKVGNEPIEGDSFVIGSGIQIIMSTAIVDGDDDDYRIILNHLRNCEVEYVYYPVDKEVSMQIMRLYTSPSGEMRLNPIWKKSRQISSEMLNATFMPFGVKYQGQSYEISPADFAKIAAEDVLYNGENVQLYGTYGTGKSTILDMIVHYLASRPDVLVIMLTPSQIQELENSTASTTLLKQLTQDPDSENPIKIVFVVDDAEAAMKGDGVHSNTNTVFLSILDGDFKTQLNCATIMSFNASKSELNQGLFRAGRSGLSAEVKPLDQEQADKAVKVLRRTHTNKVFDGQLYTELLQAENKLPNGVTYAGKGQITIADLTKQCFRTYALTNSIKDAIRRYKVGSEPQPAVQQETKAFVKQLPQNNQRRKGGMAPPA